MTLPNSTYYHIPKRGTSYEDDSYGSLGSDIRSLLGRSSSPWHPLRPTSDPPPIVSLLSSHRRFFLESWRWRRRRRRRSPSPLGARWRSTASSSCAADLVPLIEGSKLVLFLANQCKLKIKVLITCKEFTRTSNLIGLVRNPR